MRMGAHCRQSGVECCMPLVRWRAMQRRLARGVVSQTDEAAARYAAICRGVNPSIINSALAGGFWRIDAVMPNLSRMRARQWRKYGHFVGQCP